MSSHHALIVEAPKAGAGLRALALFLREVS
jgi:hypothetical protein